MCGICGFNWKNEELLTNMMSKLVHRGPDDSGFYTDDDISLGHQRLSIIDLTERGKQPMFDESKRYAITYNGEVYNYIELREELIKKGYSFKSDTDTEVVLKMYIEYGLKVLDYLNGMFAFAIYDKKEKELFLARDRFGIKPLYYYVADNSFIFSSEIPPILLHKIKVEPNDKLICDFLLYNITDHTDETFFNPILKFPKGHYATYNLKNNEFILTKWWENRYCTEDIEYPIAVKKLHNLLSDAVNIRLRSDVPVGTCLSGGIDSSSIACLIDSSKKSEIKTFSAIFPGFRLDESRYIDIVCGKKGMENHKTEPTAEKLRKEISDFIRAQGEPVPGTSPYSQYCVMRLAKENDTTVLLDGQGSDELLAGYHYFYGFYFKGLLKNLHLRKFFSEFYNLIKGGKWKIGLYSLIFLFLPSFLQQYYFRRKSNINKKFYKLNDTDYLKNYYSCSNLKAALAFHVNYKLEHLLKWEDRNSMAHSREARVPFLDHRVTTFLGKLPLEYVINSGKTKALLRDAMQEIVPPEILERRDKIGFATPEDEWLREPGFKILMKELFFDNVPLCSKYIDIEKTKKMIDSHLSKKKDRGRTLWKAIFLEIWLQCFFLEKLTNENLNGSK